MASLTVSITIGVHSELEKSDVETNYVAVHNASNADSIANPIGRGYIVGQANGITEQVGVHRLCFFLDASALPDNAIISDVKFRFTAAEAVLEDNAFTLHVVTGEDATNPLVVGDYGRLLSATTSLGSIASSSIVANGYNDITLTAAGRALVSVSGITALALRSSRDIDGNDPVIIGDETVYEYVRISHETIERPQIVITYTVPVGYSWGAIIG